jgi:hypothetical protein
MAGLQPVKYGGGLLSVTVPPNDRDDRLRLGVMVTDDILTLFQSRLAPKDLALWGKKDSEEPWTATDRKRIFGAYDKTIIERAQTIGWRVYLSPLVQNRMAQWHNGCEHGPHRLKQLGDAVALAARVARGDAKLPVSEVEWKQFKAQGVDDLRRIFKKFRKAFNQRRTPPNYQEACKWLLETVDGSPRAFPVLSGEMGSLFRYFEYAKQEDDGFIGRLVLGDLKPGALFDEWGAWGRNLNPDTFRQSISVLPSKNL